MGRSRRRRRTTQVLGERRADPIGRLACEAIGQGDGRVWTASARWGRLATWRISSPSVLRAIARPSLLPQPTCHWLGLCGYSALDHLPPLPHMWAAAKRTLLNTSLVRLRLPPSACLVSVDSGCSSLLLACFCPSADDSVPRSLRTDPSALSNAECVPHAAAQVPPGCTW